MMWSIIFRVILIGFALSCIFFWICIALRITGPERGTKDWIRLFVPQGIIISWAAYVLELY